MDLYSLIPENSDRWIVHKDIIYIKYISKIPILIKKEDDIFIYLDVSIAKYVIKLVKFLEKKGVDFLFMSNKIIFDHKFSEEEIHRLNLRQYIKNISTPVFFDGFQKIEFDFSSNLAKYLVKYKCYSEFKEIYAYRRKKIMSIETDWYSNTSDFIHKREDIRNYITSLERQIKISLLF